MSGGGFNVGRVGSAESNCYWITKWNLGPNGIRVRFVPPEAEADPDALRRSFRGFGVRFVRFGAGRSRQRVLCVSSARKSAE